MAIDTTASHHKLRGKHILVVEDHEFMGKLLVDVLKHYDHASLARSAKQALAEIHRRAPAVVLLDVSLPDMNGLELVKMMRRTKEMSSIPILAMSASPDEKSKCLEAGCNGFILKPFDIDHLLSELSAQFAS
jgi:DNA-binding response OmpR family regulator